METKLEQIAVKAVNQLPKSVVREIRTPRSVGAGGGRPPPATRWDGKRGVGHRPQATAPILDSTECMVRPRVARGFVNLADAVLHQCIRPLIGACCAPGHHGYQRDGVVFSDHAAQKFDAVILATGFRPGSDVKKRFMAIAPDRAGITSAIAKTG